MDNPLTDLLLTPWIYDSGATSLGRNYSQLVARITIDKTNGKLLYQTEETFAHMLMLRMFMGGCAALPRYDTEFEIAYTDNGKMTIMSYNYGRPQTIQNNETGRIDKWDHFDWMNYSKLEIDKKRGIIVIGI